MSGLAIVRDVVGTARQQQVSFLAAAIAYYTFVSFVPLAALAFVLATIIGGERFAAAVLAAVGAALSPSAAELLRVALVSGNGRGGLTLLGLAVLAWSGLRVFRGVDVAFTRIYASDERVTLVEQLRDATLVLGGIGIAVLAVVAVTGAVAVVGAPLAGFAGPVAAAVVLTVVFLPLYYVFPDVPMTVHDAVPGAAFAAGGWTVLGTAFGLYTAYARSYELYGVVGGVLLLVTWFYFASYVLVLGAVLNAVLADDRQAKDPAGHTGER
ncbi:MAG: YihY/virulence factor BrkB family protein [Haloarculaceae archaeon]